MTLELNVFNLCKQPYEEDENEEANMIETILSDYIQTGSNSDPLEVSLVNSFESSMHLDHDISNICSLLDYSQGMENKGWRLKFEELPPRSNVIMPSSIQSPKLELKPLPPDLKYSFLGEDGTFPVIISSKLDEHKEGKLFTNFKNT